MLSKKKLLKELGWTEDLIRHYMIDDSEYIDDPTPELLATIYDTNSYVITSNPKMSGNSVWVVGNKKNTKE